MVYLVAAYGAMREGLYHPLSRPKYRQWLQTTPWSSRQALPLGPIHLVWQDGLVLGAFSLIAYYEFAVNPLLYLDLFGVVYLTGLGFSLFFGGQPYFGWGVCAGIVGALGLFPQARLMTAVLAATYLLGYIGLRRSLAAFPWEDKLLVRPRYDVWFPSPEITKIGVSMFNALLASILLGALCYVLLKDFVTLMELQLGKQAPAEAVFTQAIDEQIILLEKQLAVWTALLSAARVAVYCLVYWPPMNPLGRLATGRLILPKYDKVFVAPALAVIVAIFLPEQLLALGLASIETTALTAACVVFINLGLGPTLREWQLTGAHRMVQFKQNIRPTPNAGINAVRSGLGPNH